MQRFCRKHIVSPFHRLVGGLSLAICLAACGVAGSPASDGRASDHINTDPPVTIFAAKTILTMDPDMPEAGAVAVAEGRILALGASPEALSAEFSGRTLVFEERFAESVLLPGLIDPHIHPIMAAILLPMVFITPEDWHLPRGEVAGVRTPEAYRQRLTEALAATPGEAPFFTWGWHPLWHGAITRADLDALAPDRPVIVWQRSFHEIVVNTAARSWMGLESEVVFEAALAETGADPTHADYETGIFHETAMALALPRLAPAILSPDHLSQGFADMQAMITASGVTTIADMGVGLFAGVEAEIQMMADLFEREEGGARLILVPVADRIASEYGSLEEGLTALAARRATWPYEKLILPERVKLLADGAFFAQFMQMGPPGYLDGHDGKWITEPDALAEMATTLWQAGQSLHIHVNGDLGLKVVLDILDGLEVAKAPAGQDVVLEHLGYSAPEQTERIVATGAKVSAQPNYVYVLADKYAEVGLGPERAHEMSRLGSLARAGVTVTLHSDLTMAPVDPLYLAWVAANRETMEGRIVAPYERLSLEEALAAITINAAEAIGMDHEIGSITPGKRADFTALASDPRIAGAGGLKDLEIDGTVFEGTVRPLER